jgi:uncharacterized PurR-regulated membrane protein YhhQ (DUF165 family)
MEIKNETLGNGLVSRAIALGMAFAATAIIATSTAVIFTAAGGSGFGSAVARIAAAPVRHVLFG